MNVLNSGGDVNGVVPVPETPEQLGTYLQKAMLQIKAAHMDREGRGVDYASLTSSEAFSEYVRVAQQLVNCDPTQLPEEERMAFFINIYNCLTIHGLASSEQLPASVLEVSKFWSQTAYSINGVVFSLDDIEHGVLRGNRPHPSASTPPFGADDARRGLSMTTCDPRIHFTLVCGAKSCPAIQVYSAKNLERALSMAAQNFCSQEVQVLAHQRKVLLSKIFLWYASDFGSNQRDLLKCVSRYVSDEKSKADLEEMLSSSEEVNIEFKDYNWQLNKL